jgi:hypothetical protein
VPRKVFYSFYYDDDASRVQQVKNMGVIESQPLLDGNKWEEVRRGGDPAIEKWIATQMAGKACAVVLVGERTASRPWVEYEIKKAWKDGLGVVGIRIHGLKDLRSQLTSAKGESPFAGLVLGATTFSQIVRLYEPPGADSKAVYASISNNLEALVEEAIKIRAKYPK